MDCYFGSDMDEFVVPEDEELSDRLPSPDSWLNWEFNSSGIPNKFLDANLTRDVLNFNGKYFCDEVDMDTSFHDKDQFSWSSLGGLSDKSLELAAFSQDWPDYQLNDLAGIEKMDDIFLSSILEEPLGSKNIHKPFYSSQESQRGMNPADIFSKDMVLDEECVSSAEHDLRSSKYLNENVYSSPLGWDEGDDTDSQSFKALVKGSTLPAKNSIDGHMDKKTSLEESVLQELEMVMVQFNEKTRVCFRDSLYRLANNSTQQHIVPQTLNRDIFMEKAPPQKSCDGTTRSRRKRATESKTNTIDRAIANLMFNKMESNVRNIPSTAIAKFKREAVKAKGTHNYNSNQHQCCTTFTGDAEVPVHSQRHPYPKFLTNSAGRRIPS